MASSCSSNSASATPSKQQSNTTNNNYAAPHTPIASAKRSRSSLEGAARTSSTSKLLPPGMSPMHPPRSAAVVALAHSQEEESPVVMTSTETPSSSSSSWVGQQVNALFSPVLSFLGNGSSKDENEEEEEESSSTTAVVTDEDVAMVDQNHEAHVQEHSHSEDDEEEEENLSHDMADLEETPSSFDDEEEFNPYLFIKSLPRYELVCGKPRTCLPPKLAESPPMTLVLDLDETLVHCTVDAIENANLVFPVLFHGMEYQVHVRLRPYLFEFLEHVSKRYEVVVFTASQKVYADELLNRIDPDGKYIHHRLFRESCLAVEGNFLKDLSVLGRNLNTTVLVDNSPHAFGYQVDNGIPIESWFDDDQDTELLKLQQFLTTLEHVPDVRTVVRRQFQTFERVQSA